MLCPLTKEIVHCWFVSFTNQMMCTCKHISISSFFLVAMMCSLYWSLIWLQMFFIWYDYKYGSTMKKRERREEKSVKERSLHQHYHRECHIIITIIIILLAGFFFYPYSQLIRLLCVTWLSISILDIACNNMVGAIS
jgi:hypothetical protein